MIYQAAAPPDSPLAFPLRGAYLTPAMTRLLILLIGLVWASLLLVSWGGNSEAQLVPADGEATAIHPS